MKTRRKTNMLTSTCSAADAGGIMNMASKMLIAAHNVGGYGLECTLEPDTDEGNPNEASVSCGKFKVIGTGDGEGYFAKVSLLVNGESVDSVDEFIEQLDAAVESREEVNPNFNPMTAMLSAMKLLTSH